MFFKKKQRVKTEMWRERLGDKGRGLKGNRETVMKAGLPAFL